MTREINIQKLVRPHIRTLKAYSSARDEFDGTAEIYLDANENAYGSVITESYNRYPDPLQRALKERLSDIRGLASDQIFIGNGSDEAIDLLFRAFCEPGKDHVMIFPPTYGMYQVSADINQVKTVSIPLNEDFSLDLKEIIPSIRPGTKMMFICRPNNPTGNSFEEHKIKTILDRFAGLVVVDEAYVDFSEGNSLLAWIKDYPNLVVLQTFSKAWGMAALRLGVAYGHSDLIEVLNRLKPPYNVNAYSQKQAIEALSQMAIYQNLIEKILEQRNFLERELNKIEEVAQVYPSDANFLLARVRNANEVYLKLIQKGIIVRNRTRLSGCQDCLRITVGTEEENQKLIEGLKDIYSSF